MSDEAFDSLKCALTLWCPFNWTLSFVPLCQLRDWIQYLTASWPEIAVVLYHAYEVANLRFVGRSLHVKHSLHLLGVRFNTRPVSYTHLTLPTIYSV